MADPGHGQIAGCMKYKPEGDEDGNDLARVQREVIVVQHTLQPPCSSSAAVKQSCSSANSMLLRMRVALTEAESGRLAECSWRPFTGCFCRS